MFDKIGMQFKTGKFNALFNRSVFYSRAILQRQIPYGQSTVRGMMMAMQELGSMQ